MTALRLAPVVLCARVYLMCSEATHVGPTVKKFRACFLVILDFVDVFRLMGHFSSARPAHLPCIAGLGCWFHGSTEDLLNLCLTLNLCLINSGACTTAQ